MNSFAAVGISVAFQAVVLAALVARGWKPAGDAATMAARLEPEPAR